MLTSSKQLSGRALLTIAVATLSIGSTTNAQSRIEKAQAIQAANLQKFLLGAEENRAAIKDGSALTCMTRALYETSLTGAQTAQGAVTHEEAAHLRFCTADGRGATFRGHSGVTLELHWPASLRTPEYRELRQQVITARNAFIEGSTSVDDEENTVLDALGTVIDSLKTTFEENNPWEVRTVSMPVCMKYHQARNWLIHLRRTVDRLADEQGAKPSASIQFTGGTLHQLIQHVNQWGLSYAPALPADEATYFAIYSRLRKLCEEKGLIREIATDSSGNAGKQDSTLSGGVGAAQARNWSWWYTRYSMPRYTYRWLPSYTYRWIPAYTHTYRRTLTPLTYAGTSVSPITTTPLTGSTTTIVPTSRTYSQPTYRTRTYTIRVRR